MFQEESLEKLKDLYAYCTPTKERPIEDCNINFSKIQQIVDDTDLVGTERILHAVYDRYYMLVNQSNAKEILNERHLERLIFNNGKKFLRSKTLGIKNIIVDFDLDLANMDPEYENRCINEIYNSCVERFNEYRIREPELPFVDTIEDFKVTALKDSIQGTLQDSLEVFFKGKNVGKDYMIGVDVLDYLKTGIADIELKYGDQVQEDSGVVDSYESMRAILDSASETYKRVTDTGLAPVDEAFSDLHTTQILTITGSPGAGKSRIANRIIYRARVLDKNNCYIWSGEMSKFEILCIQLAQHCWYHFGHYIDDKMIKLYYDKEARKDEEKYKASEYALTEEDAEILHNAELDFTHGNYGKLIIEDGTLFVEDFEAKMLYYKKKYDISLFAIDYLLLLSSSGKNPFKRVFNKTEMLEFIMGKAKKCAKELGMLGIILNQLDKETIKSILAGNNATVTASKYSSAPIDFADFNMVISSDEAMYNARKVKLHCPKVRSGRRYKPFIADENAGVCDYRYNDEDVEDDAI